jgi:hypothetical protein
MSHKDTLFQYNLKSPVIRAIRSNIKPGRLLETDGQLKLKKPSFIRRLKQFLNDQLIHHYFLKVLM